MWMQGSDRGPGPRVRRRGGAGGASGSTAARGGSSHAPSARPPAGCGRRVSACARDAGNRGMSRAPHASSGSDSGILTGISRGVGARDETRI
eukprot:764861-Prymnesium_polylepis.1